MESKKQGPICLSQFPPQAPASQAGMWEGADKTGLIESL